MDVTVQVDLGEHRLTIDTAPEDDTNSTVPAGPAGYFRRRGGSAASTPAPSD
ncbi:hypothetical protein [Micromonospora sp. NPDC051141]|uniref:hypothetical protein n=1 Tax=Micromonospora sp. NPDC051141 TaxID=3364284 RepID=UPI00379FCB81